MSHRKLGERCKKGGRSNDTFKGNLEKKRLRKRGETVTHKTMEGKETTPRKGSTTRSKSVEKGREGDPSRKFLNFRVTRAHQQKTGKRKREGLKKKRGVKVSNSSATKLAVKKTKQGNVSGCRRGGRG